MPKSSQRFPGKVPQTIRTTCSKRTSNANFRTGRCRNRTHFTFVYGRRPGKHTPTSTHVGHKQLP